MGTATAVIKRLTPRQGSGRIANAVAELLNRQLTVPEVYIRPRSAGLAGIDVLAVDHAGSGDVHGVVIVGMLERPNTTEIASIFSNLKGLPLHYKYLALPLGAENTSNISGGFKGTQAFSSDGIGRIGLITYSAEFFYEDASISAGANAFLAIKPERFLLRGGKLAMVERFLEKRQPDIRVRI